MPLDRATCEALRALPEVRDHKCQPGDWYWYQVTDDHPWSEPVAVCDEWGTYDCIEGEPVRVMEWTRWVWRPGLTHLLSLAQAHRPAFDGALRLWCYGPTDFRFGLADEAGSVGYQGQGDTPESAVAAWLLAHAEAGR